LSYSRLMALGLATGIIGFAMNLTAQVLGDVIPGVAGVIVMVFFILFGHSLNLALSFLGAFVHSMRLQFIEFFGRFYTGGAPLFAPFMRKTKYLFIRQD
jgi:V/A-type H+-transporting ATPase subunit I